MTAHDILHQRLDSLEKRSYFLREFLPLSKFVHLQEALADSYTLGLNHSVAVVFEHAYSLRFISVVGYHK